MGPTGLSTRARARTHTHTHELLGKGKAFQAKATAYTAGTKAGRTERALTVRKTETSCALAWEPEWSQRGKLRASLQGAPVVSLWLLQPRPLCEIPLLGGGQMAQAER